MGWSCENHAKATLDIPVHTLLKLHVAGYSFITMNMITCVAKKKMACETDS